MKKEMKAMEITNKRMIELQAMTKEELQETEEYEEIKKMWETFVEVVVDSIKTIIDVFVRLHDSFVKWYKENYEFLEREIQSNVIDVDINPKIDVNIGRKIPYHVPTINELGLSNNLTNGV